MKLRKQFMEGLITNNPVLVQVIGMCSTMAITTSLFNGVGMGVAVTVILTLSNIIIAAIRKIIPDKIRIAMFIVVIAGFVTCVDLLIQAFVPALSESLGVFHPGPGRGVLLQERRGGLLLGRHLPGHRLHCRAGGHVRHP